MPITGSQKAKMYAQSGVERCGATRTGYHSPRPFVAIDGVHYATAAASATARVLDETLSINDILDETPNTCDFRARGFEPVAGQDVVVTLGSKNNLDREFAGTILTVTAKYKGAPANREFDVKATDYTWHLTRRKISRRWTNTSVTQIVKDIVAEAPGFTTLHVQAGLETIDEFTVTNETLMAALLRAATRIGAYCDVDYHHDVHFGVTDTSATDPVDLQSGTQFEDLAVTRDLTPVITRVLVEGGGVNALAACAPGETTIPVQDVAWYNPTGGRVTSGPQRITYTAAIAGGGGGLVGPGATPSAPPTAALKAGTGITSGVHDYAFTFVTAAGESLPSPLARITTTVYAAPSAAPSVDQTDYGSGTVVYTAGDTVQNVITYSYATSSTDFTKDTGPSPVSTRTAVAGSSGTANADALTFAHSAQAGIRWIHLWRKVNLGPVYEYVTSFANVPGSSTTTADGFFTTAQTLPTAAGTLEQADLTAIAIGPSGTTSRKVYRTEAGGTQLKLLTTLADNTTTIYTDSSADGSLGANAPASDMSGLTQPTGQITAGATSLLLTGVGAFSATGGWAIIGNGQQVVRYTGTSGNSLTGIPASGPGAITASISYNSTVTAAPSLKGVPASGTGAILYDIKAGDPVNLLVQCDDVIAQSLLAARLGGGDDGVIEEYVADGRISETEARARGEAILALHARLQESLAYSSHDNNLHSGRTQGVNVTDPTTLSGDFKVQQVTTSNFWPERMPKREANASSTRFSLENLLQLARKAST